MTDRSEIKRALAGLYRPGDTAELRCVGGGPVISGFFRDQDKLADAAVALNEQGRNVYVCLNPISPALYEQRPERTAVVSKNQTTKNKDAACRRWLLIDVDPIRPSGESATDEESATAETVASLIYNYLQNAGLPRPVVGLSGNGRHLLLPLADWPNNQKSTRICKKFLQHLADRFSNDHAKVDLTTGNAARICTLYGTTKRKGQATAERPHRTAQLLAVPDPAQAATVEQLEAVIGVQQEQPERPQQQQQPSAGAWDIQQLLDERGVQYEQDAEFEADDGTRAVRYVLPVCPFNESHDNSSAVLIQWPSGAVSFTCHHDSCQSKDWQALKDLWGLRGITEADIVLPQAAPQSLLLIRSRDVQPESIEWLWQDRLVMGGFNLLAGRGGLGKSFFLCDLVARITNDQLPAPNGQPLRHGRVLFSSGEDHISKILEPRMRSHAVNRQRLDYIAGMATGDEVLLLDVIQHCRNLELTLQQLPDTVALILDPVSCFQGTGDSNKVADVRRFTAVLTRIAERFNLAIIGVHHFNKGRREQAGDSISGSHAYRDAARSAWLFGLDKSDSSRRLAVCDKHNWAERCPSGFAYTVEQGKLVYEAEPLDMTPDELVNQATEKPIDIATTWLLQKLAAGPQSATDVQIAATLQGIKDRTLNRAKKQLGVESYREGEHWHWKLPECQPV